MFTININVNDNKGIKDSLERIEQFLHDYRSQYMSDVDDFRAQFAAIDAATNDIAADIANLSAQIVPGMAQADVDALKGELALRVTALEAVAAVTP